MRELGSQITVKRLVAEAVLTASASAVTVDRGSANSNVYEGLAFAFHVGAGGITFTGTNLIALKLEESDDNSTFNVVGSAAVVLGAANPAGTNFAQAPDSNGYVRLITAAKAGADTDPFKVSYVGNKRYVKATVFFGGTHATGTLVGLYAVLGFPAYMPAQ